MCFVTESAANCQRIYKGKSMEDKKENMKTGDDS